MKGYEFDPVAKTMKWHYGSRVVMQHTGQLLELLPAEHDYTGTVSFTYPDVPKGTAYRHGWQTEHIALGGWGQASYCRAWVGAKPQEWSTQSVLTSAPAGADFAALLVKMSRTAAPSHDWDGEPIAVHPETGVTIPFTGSQLMESAMGMVRAASIIIDDAGWLILHRQQSVSTPPGSWGSRSGSRDNGLLAYGSDWYAPSGECLPVWTGTGVPYARSATRTLPEDVFRPSPLRTCDIGGSSPCSASDPTNYRSTWAFQITAMFGNYSRIVS